MKFWCWNKKIFNFLQSVITLYLWDVHYLLSGWWWNESLWSWKSGIIICTVWH